MYVPRPGSPAHISGIKSQINSKVIVKNTNTVPTRFNFRLPLDPGVRSEADYWEQESQLAALFFTKLTSYSSGCFPQMVTVGIYSLLIPASSFKLNLV